MKNAREIVIAGEKAGLSHKEMAEICGVSAVTISRWKITRRARTSVISKLERHLNSLNNSPENRKYLDGTNLEDLAERARQLGFRATFTDIRADEEVQKLTDIPKGGRPMILRMKNNIDFKSDYDRKRVEGLCKLLIEGERGKTLGKEILEQLGQGHLDEPTYRRLSRWVNPERAEYFAQPIAAEISRELFGEKIQRTK